jgi:hypothetical protein
VSSLRATSGTAVSLPSWLGVVAVRDPAQGQPFWWDSEQTQGSCARVNANAFVTRSSEVTLFWGSAELRSFR